MRRPLEWTAYRRYYVRTLLARGASVALIAERLGVEPRAVRYGVRKYGLDQPEAADA